MTITSFNALSLEEKAEYLSGKDMLYFEKGTPMCICYELEGFFIEAIFYEQTSKITSITAYSKEEFLQRQADKITLSSFFAL